MEIQKNRIIIYGECYAPITLALYKQQQNFNITLITINENVKKFCDFSGIPCIYFKRIPLNITRISNLNKFKNKIKSIINKLNINKNDKFYIVDNSFALEGFYFSYLLKNKTNLFYFKTIECNITYKYSFSKDFLYSKLNIFFYKIFLKLDLVLKNVNNKPVVGLDQIFYKKNNIKMDDESLDFYQMKLNVVSRNKIIVNSYNIMFADQGVCHGIIKYSQMELIMNVLKTNINNIVIKEHPQFKQPELFSEFAKYPDFIPSEFLFGSIKKYIISIFSTTLITAAKQKHLKALSLLEIVEWENQSYKKQFKKRLMEESNNNIIFIETIEELEKIINE